MARTIRWLGLFYDWDMAGAILGTGIVSVLF